MIAKLIQQEHRVPAGPPSRLSGEIWLQKEILSRQAKRNRDKRQDGGEILRRSPD